MDYETVCDNIEQANGEDIQSLLDAVIRRYQALFPEWEILTIALPADQSKQMERKNWPLSLLKSMGYKRNWEGISSRSIFF